MPFLQGGWGGILFVAGVIGGNVAGYVSDVFFHSRRAPAAGGLYFALFVCTIVMALVMGKTTTEVALSTMAIRGKAAPGSKVLVDGRSAVVDEEGKYKAEVNLARGQEQVEIRIIDAQGAITTESRPVNVLRPGDKVLAVAGVGNLTDWVDVRKAIRRFRPRPAWIRSRSGIEDQECSIAPRASGDRARPPGRSRWRSSATAADHDQLDDWAIKRAGEPR